MTRQRSFKQLVRARMDKTGESYTAARAMLLAAEVPPAAPQAPAESKAVLEALQSISARLDRLERREAPAPSATLPAPAAAPGTHPGLAILVGSCGKCHERTVAAGKGGNVVLTEGGALAALPPALVADCQADIYDGTMPKGSKLTDEQVGQLMDLFKKLKRGGKS